MNLNNLKPFLILFTLFAALSFIGCASIPKQSVELAEITETQTAELQKSHIRFVQLYYDKLRDDINDFIEKKWMPLFLSKAVKNEEFRKALDEAYITSNINAEDVQVTWKGQALRDPEKSAVISGIEKAISDERARLGTVLLDFSEAALFQINKKRKELFGPIDEQERYIIDEINAAYSDLYSAQASIKGFLALAVEVKQKQELVLKELGVLEHSKKIINTALDANESLSMILGEKDGSEETVKAIINEMKAIKDKISEKLSITE